MSAWKEIKVKEKRAEAPEEKIASKESLFVFMKFIIADREIIVILI